MDRTTAIHPEGVMNASVIPSFALRTLFKMRWPSQCSCLVVYVLVGRFSSGRGTASLFRICSQWLTPKIAILVARLEVKNGMITEIETEVSRTVPGATNLEKMGGPRQAFLQDLSPAQRVTREGLVRIANMYFTGLEKNDGKGEYPFGDDCDRIENGNHTTNNKSFTTGSGFANGQGAPAQGSAAQSAPAQAPASAAQSFNPQSTSPINPASMGCLEQFKTGYFHFVTRIRDRRYVVVDTQKGVAFGFVFFDHAAGSSRTFHLADGREITTGPVRPWTWEIAEMFKISGGKIHEVEAVLNDVPYGMTSGWDDNWQDAMSSRSQ
jgi:hypothetical protein